MQDPFITRSSVLQALSRHIGAGNGVHIGQLAREIVHCPTDAATERRIRTLIEELRRDGAAICALPATGYFMAANPDELEITCKFLFDRAMSSLTQCAAMKKISLPDLAGQLHIKT